MTVAVDSVEVGADRRGYASADKDMSVAAERSLLGAILLDNSVMEGAQEVVRAEDFYWPPCRELYRAMLRLAEQRMAIDAVTLGGVLSAEQLAVVGGYGAIAEAAISVPSALHARHYAKIIRERAAVRRLRAELNCLAALTAEPREDASGIYEEVDRRLTRIISGYREISSDEPALAESLETAFNFDHGEGLCRVTTGLSGLDRLVGGLTAGELVVLAAHTSAGKTTLGLQVAARAAERVPVLYVSMEMRVEQLARRLIATQAGIDAAAVLRRGGWDEFEEDRVAAAKVALGQLNLRLRYRPGAQLDQLLAMARAMMRQAPGPLGLVVVDYLTLMRFGPAERRDLAVAEVTNSLKRLAGEHLAILLLAQFNRAGKRRDYGPPRLEDLRESGAIEDDADQVWLLWQPPVKPGREDKVELIVAKNRNGPRGRVGLRWTPEFVRFEDWPS